MGLFKKSLISDSVRLSGFQEIAMFGRKNLGQTEMVFAGSIAEFIPDDHILMRELP